MSEAATRIVQLERRVMWRNRLLSLQNGLALAIAAGGLIAAVLVLSVRFRATVAPLWSVIIFPLAVSFAVMLTRWFLARTSVREAASLIDQSLGLEDRVASSRMILERGGPKRAIEEALIEDTAAQVGNHHATSVVPFRLRRRHALPLVSVLAIGAALMVPQRSLPVTEAMATERADIDNAGEHLEQTATEVELLLPPETETASLAKEQAELGRALRRSAASRADALKRLSAVEERIRQRHNDLASTHADEIVSLAERRLGGTLSELPTTRRKSPVPEDNEITAQAERLSGANEKRSNKARSTEATNASRSPSRLTQEKGDKLDPTTSQPRTPTAEDRPNVGDTTGKGKVEPKPQKRLQEPVVGRRDKPEPGRAGSAKAERAKAEPGSASEPVRRENNGDQKASDLKLDSEKTGEQKPTEPKAGDQPGNEPNLPLDALKAVPNSVAEQAAKALPRVSEELLKKAGQLRANELTPADIQRLRQAAETLSKELTQIAESEELRKALEEMARQVRPEQIEQVARQLEGHEKLKEELTAAGRLLMENQQAKEIVAGLSEQVARARDEMRGQRIERADEKGRERSGRDEQARSQASSGRRRDGEKPLDQSENATDRRILSGLGKASSLNGTHQKGSPGQYLYLRSKAGVGAARAPYSLGYPQYRREAERSVQRSQVPTNLRSVVRKYFDAINPDAKR